MSRNAVKVTSPTSRPYKTRAAPDFSCSGVTAARRLDPSQISQGQLNWSRTLTTAL
jgi:hypothetical protein